jgi:hypothetical protein
LAVLEPDVTVAESLGHEPAAGSTTRAMRPEADSEVDVTREYAAIGTRVGAGSAWDAVGLTTRNPAVTTPTTSEDTRALLRINTWSTLAVRVEVPYPNPPMSLRERQDRSSGYHHD